MLRALPLLVLLALPVVAVADPLPPAKVAELVREADVDTEALTEALHSSDALARATAARVVNVREASAMLPALRETFAVEKNADAAREELRALVALGNDNDVSVIAKRLPSYSALMDAAFAEAVARLGAPRAIDLYVAHVAPLRAISGRVNFFTLALWNHADLATATASRLLGLHDVRGWRELLHAADDGRVAIAPEVLTAAMQSNVAAIREETLWSVVREHPFRGFPLPEGLQPLIAGARVDATARELAARELLRRAGGLKPRDNDAIVEWAATEEAKDDFLRGSSSLLTKRERQAYGGFTRETGSATDDDIPAPDLAAPAPLPAGLASAVLTAHACTGGWVGTGSLVVDEKGRTVQTMLEKVYGTEACGAALDTLLRLSLAEPSTMTSSTTAKDVTFVAPESGTPCFDEVPVTSSARPERAPLDAAYVTPAEVLERATPQFPLEAKRSMFQNDDDLEIAVIEATITTAGCAADLRVVQPSNYESLDDSALLSVARFTFKPATRDGAPVASVARVVIKFQLK